MQKDLTDENENSLIEDLEFALKVDEIMQKFAKAIEAKDSHLE